MSDAARELEKSKMARFDEKSGNLYVTELGRVASHFYIKHSSIVMYNDLLKRHMSEAEVQTLGLQAQKCLCLKWSLCIKSLTLQTHLPTVAVACCESLLLCL